jgi:formylglycine-generating enzyme required for sulfatase activity
VIWYEAAAYCNWLSKQEGIPEDQWCYETNAQQLAQEQVGIYATLVLPHHPLAAAASTSYFLLHRPSQVTALKEHYLSLRGYRLPTEAEMEYATRAGALTSRYYGETEELLPKYAWYYKAYSQGRTCPVGSLKPNDLGLFDVQGNVFSWCQERYKEYPAGKGDEAVEDQEDGLVVTSTDSRVLRGGLYTWQAKDVRSAFRFAMVPDFRHPGIGIRPARTLPLGSNTALPHTAEGGRK